MHDKPPSVRRDTPESRILIRHWHEARDARDLHRKRLGTRGNIEMAFAGHKMDWLKALLREIDQEP
jgi:hypothetical protein